MRMYVLETCLSSYFCGILVSPSVLSVDLVSHLSICAS